ncbi:MAG: anti-sigma factor domain-containing protein [Planctomycetota bacterium]|jgi:anti-sigma-K factor RskA
MSDHTGPDMRRIDELLADEALRTLAPEEALELARLRGDEQDESYELAAAALELALHDHEETPASDVMARLESSVLLRVASESASAPDAFPISSESSGEVVTRYTALPWLAMAAALLLAVLGWLPSPLRSPVDGRDTLMASSASYKQWDWGAVHADDSVMSGYVEGDVVWSDADQEGYMRFVGLGVNDPSVEQYQLWIFDAERSADRPVDGGVFDVTESGEVVVRIDPKLPISEATMFAITVERPGGVVVSDRSRLPLLAQPTS